MMIVCEALRETAYQVGSSTDNTDYRDVDVRIIMDDDKFNALFGNWTAHRWMPFWSLFCASTSYYLRRLTDLPIDFQVQRRGDVKDVDWNEMRVPTGHFPRIMNADVQPAWMDERGRYYKPTDDPTDQQKFDPQFDPNQLTLPLDDPTLGPREC